MANYQVLFNGEVADAANVERVRINLARELGLDERKAKQLFSGRITLTASLEQIIGKRQHAAARVMNQHDFIGVQQVMRDDQAANGIFGNHAPGIADDVRFACLQTQQILDIEAGIHTRHDGYSSGRLYRL